MALLGDSGCGWSRLHPPMLGEQPTVPLPLGVSPPPPTIMCAVSQGDKAQNLRPTALTPAREAGTWNCVEHTEGHWPHEHVMN